MEFSQIFTRFSGGDCLPLASQYLNFLSSEDENTLSIARKVNENLPYTIAKLVDAKLKLTFPDVSNFEVLILGIAYKPNTSSIKGSLVPTLLEALKKHQLNIDVFDPIAEPSEIQLIGNITQEKKYHLIIKATNHQVFEELNCSMIGLDNYLTFDINQFTFK